MKVAACLLTVALLTACAGCSMGAQPDRVQEIEDIFQSGGLIALRADITADLGDRVFVAGLSLSETDIGSCEITVESPAEISGIKARFQTDSSQLVFDDVALELGTMPNTAISPINALPIMLSAWRSGYLIEHGSETVENIRCIEMLWSVSAGAEQLEVRTWFDETNLKPVKTEISTGGLVIITCLTRDVSIGSGTTSPAPAETAPSAAQGNEMPPTQ